MVAPVTRTLDPPQGRGWTMLGGTRRRRRPTARAALLTALCGLLTLGATGSPVAWGDAATGANHLPASAPSENRGGSGVSLVGFDAGPSDVAGYDVWADDSDTASTGTNWLANLVHLLVNLASTGRSTESGAGTPAASSDAPEGGSAPERVGDATGATGPAGAVDGADDPGAPPESASGPARSSGHSPGQVEGAAGVTAPTDDGDGGQLPGSTGRTSSAGGATPSPAPGNGAASPSSSSSEPLSAHHPALVALYTLAVLLALVAMVGPRLAAGWSGRRGRPAALAVPAGARTASALVPASASVPALVDAPPPGGAPGSEGTPTPSRATRLSALPPEPVRSEPVRSEPVRSEPVPWPDPSPVPAPPAPIQPGSPAAARWEPVPFPPPARIPPWLDPRSQGDAQDKES